MKDYKEAISKFSPAWSQMTDIIVSRAEGCNVYDQKGKAFLDFISGIGVVNTGHCHPRIVEAIREQAGLLIHQPATIMLYPPLLELVEEMSTIVPPGMDGFFFANCGGEAIENAVKIARYATGKPNVICFQGSFHGRTIGTMSLTNSKVVQRAGFQPMMPGTFIAPFPYAYRYGWDPETTSEWCLNELDLIFHQSTHPSETAAILIEGVLGEGGYVIPPKSFMQGLRKICTEHDIMLIVDEVQSGYGRTGRWFAFENYDIVPDIMALAKGIASGMPLSAVVSRQDIMAKMPKGSLGGTYGGNAVAAAAAVATIKVMKEEGLLQNALERGKQLMDGLRKIQKEYPILGDVRGLGLMVGTEFSTPERKPMTDTVKAIQLACREKGLLLHTAGTFDSAFRWIPPLVVKADQIDTSLQIFTESLKKVVK